ncbi:Dam family site-specific DNA-(adenine-N6)-methyltransferase [bacterium]|nr:Dam family site-specific DNA-(adenine-N6)-methyltransferase [bacterium]
MKSNNNKTQNTATPFLRWSGSKAQLVSILGRNTPDNYATYFEPFAGSACLFFHISPDKATLGDINQEVIDAYYAIKNNPNKVHYYLSSIPKSSEGYYTIRKLDRSELTIEQSAARLIFLMKACFNGVYRTNKRNQFNVPIGSKFYTTPTLEQLHNTSNLLRNTQLISGDFETTLTKVKPGDFVYLDPPYPSNKRYRGEYGFSAHFSREDKMRLLSIAKRLTENNVHVMLSYIHDEETIKELHGWHRKYESVRRTVAGSNNYRQTINEMVMTNYLNRT